MKLIFGVALLAIATLIGITVAVLAVVLFSYGIGLLLARLLPFSLFETTLLSLASAVIVGAIAYRIIVALVAGPVVLGEDEDDEWSLDDWEEDDDEDWEEEDEDVFAPGIPRWRQRRPRPAYDKVGRNDPCPCGSGKKFKHCHAARG